MCLSQYRTVRKIWRVVNGTSRLYGRCSGASPDVRAVAVNESGLALHPRNRNISLLHQQYLRAVCSRYYKCVFYETLPARAYV